MHLKLVLGTFLWTITGPILGTRPGQDYFRTVSGFFQDNIVLIINDLYLIGGSVDSSSEQFSTEIVGGQSIE